MLNRRKLITGFSALVLVAGVTSVTTAANAAPSATDVQNQLNQLYAQAETASEHYNDTQVQLAGLQAQLADVHVDQAQQNTELSSVRQELRDAILRQFEGANLSAATQVLLAKKPGQFLEGLSTMSAYNGIQTTLLSNYDAQVSQLNLRAQATQDSLDQVTQLNQQAAADQADIKTKTAQAKKLLASLVPAQRSAVVSRDSARYSGAPVAARANVQAAVNYALAQVGKPYVYGGVGPQGFDCSGLVLMAFAQIGVSLTHGVREEYKETSRISASDLQPGDLIFYNGLAHVGMYLGGGMEVDAGTPRTGVIYRGMNYWPIYGYGRVA